jgi:acetyl-CoA carboxylase beta subunit
MNDSNFTEPIVPPLKSDSNLKDYRCPHCNKFLFKGNVKELNMVCHHCQKMIRANEKELFKSDLK